MLDLDAQWLQTSLPFTLVMSPHIWEVSTQDPTVLPPIVWQLAQTVQLPSLPEVTVQVSLKLFLAAQLCTPTYSTSTVRIRRQLSDNSI